jgi:uncharacterized membrane protein YeaQ/YmgE (transglycosylase-associated protein family)
MSFIAFLVFGGFVGFLASYCHPRSVKKFGLMQSLLWPISLGTAGAAIASILGQTFGLFRSGQMLEWILATISAIFLVFLYKMAK